MDLPQNTMDPASYYTDALNSNTRRIKHLSQRIHLLGTIRLVIIIAMIVTLITLKLPGVWAIVGVTMLFIIPFTVLMVYHNRLSSRKAYAETLAGLCENELKGLDYDFSAFDGASDKTDASHSYSFDLDMFGQRSFFQSINRTVTHGGREELAHRLIEPLTDKEAILQRQEAIKELSAESILRQHFYVTGVLNRGQKSDAGILLSLTSMPNQFANRPIWKVLVWFVPAIWIAIITATALGWLSLPVMGGLIVISALIANLNIKKVNTLHNSTGKIEKILSVYAKLMEIIESRAYDAEELKEISSRLTSGIDGTNTLTASGSVRKFSRLLGALDQRANMMMAILNIFILWDMRCVINLEKWRRDNSGNIREWFDALACFDALSSLSGFAFNHPEYIYPKIADGYFTFSGKALGHPLMNRHTCVRNDISIESHPSFMIVTGANMAGKSTYLRTVGINFVLAATGAPVWADELTVSPASLITSLRTSDSLADNESYFFAELKRLKMVIDRLKQGEKMFIILDEILKGTNSADKQRGSLALIRQFVSYGTCGIIATHDLVLGSLQDEFPDRVRNYRFEADIKGDSLDFSYTLRPGVARNMNASLLMKRMGITVG